LRAKLTYVDSEELLRVVLREVLLREDLCRREGEAAVTRYTTARALAGGATRGVPDWQERLRRALAAEEATCWYEQARRLRRLRAQLERP
jgi:hypothetical protein